MEALARYEKRLEPEEFGKGIFEDEPLEEHELRARVWDLRDIVASLARMLSTIIKEAKE